MHKTILSIACCLMTFAVLAQPSNNDCGSATTINAGQLDDGNGDCNSLNNQNITGATPWTIPPGVTYTANCWNGIDTLNVVFYEFTAQGVSGFVDVTGAPDDFFVSVIEFNGAACDGTNITEWGCGANTTVVFDNDLTIGTTYYVIVAMANNTPGNFDLCVFNPVPAVNDECDDAIVLSNLDGTPCNGGQNNYYPSSESFTPSCFPAGSTQSVWFSFTAQGVSIADLHIEGAPQDAHIAIWDFNGGTLCDLTTGTVLDCQANVDAASPLSSDNVLTPGNEYYIQVAFDNNAIGNFSVCLDAPAPAFNDDCLQAAAYPPAQLSDAGNCITSISGDNLNSDWPSTDVVAPACWDDDHTQNLWFSFTAQGPDVDVEVVPSFGGDAQIALVAFAGGNACDPASAIILDCSSDGTLEHDNALVPNATYYVMVGFDTDQTGDYCINIFNPTPPLNDGPCGATVLPVDGSCNVGTTEFANPEFPPAGFPPECQANLENTAWFTIELDDPNSVGFEINIEEISGQDFTLVIGTFDNCSGTFFTEALECGQNFPYNFGPVTDPDQIYYLMVGSSEAGAGTFNICVQESTPCFENNECDGPSGAEAIQGLTTGGGFVCIDGCNQWASPSTLLPLCQQDQNPTVWYLIFADAAASTLNINLTSTDIAAPTMSLYTGTCDNLIPVTMNDDDHCAVGSGGSVVATADVDPATVYFLAVSGVNTDGGDFELCVNTVAEETPCVIDASQAITFRSFGGSLSGPFLPGEQVTVCYTIHEYLIPENECQWLQGVVPVLGDGWMLTPFTLLGARLNGNMLPQPGVYAGQWEYFSDVEYNHPVSWLHVGDFDGNGTLDMCNSNYDPDCTGPSVTGGITNGECFVGGTTLPPGWFCHNKQDDCSDVGHPDDDWGDGEVCFGGPMGPWEFCLDLTVKDYPNCEQTPNSSDLTVGFFPFAHGETGAWKGSSSVCSADAPSVVKYPMCCVEDESLTEHYPEFCTPGTFAYTPDHPGVDFWEWVVNPPPNVVGPTSGSGAAGTTVVNTVNNTGVTTEIIEYVFQGYSGGNCPSVIKKVLVLAYPELVADMESFNACATPLTPYELTPDVIGGAGAYEYAWFDGSTDATLLIDDPDPGQLYSVTVSDAAGCTREAAVTLNVYETFPVEIDAPLLAQCFSDGPIDLSATASEGTPGYTFEWTSPMGNNLTGTGIAAQESGQWNVLSTDSQGCIGEDSITLNFYESPEVTVVPDIAEICPFNPVPEQITALAAGGVPPYSFSWDMPNGSSANSFIFAQEVGAYSILVTDQIGCTTEIAFDVSEAEYPQVDLGDEVTICAEDLLTGYELEVPFDPSYTFYQWSTGVNQPGIEVNQEGTYTVTVTNAGGCIGTADVVIDTYDPIPDVFPFDTATFCESGVAEIEGPFDYTYEWSTGGTSNPLFVVATQNIAVTVTDENGCTTEDVFDVVESTSLLPNIQGDTVLCNQQAVEISCASFALIDWYDNPELIGPISSGDNTLTVNSPGWYFVQVSDGNGCFGVDSVQVIESDPQVMITGETAICDGDMASLEVGIWAEVSWSTGESQSTITTDTAGSFSVTVTDDNGCTASANIDVVTSDAPVMEILGSTTFCTGGSTTLDAGGPFTSYAWSTGESTQTINVSNPGQVIVTVTNQAGCSTADTVVVSEEDQLTPTISGDTVLCGTDMVTLDAGAGYSSYQWSSGGGMQTLGVSVAGVYTVTVSDANGCTGTDVAIVNAGLGSVNITGDNAFCNGESAELTASAGFDNYEWSTGESTQLITVSTSGMYSVSATDAAGCVYADTVVIDVFTLPNASITGSSTFCTGGSTTLDGGDGFASYAWSTGETTQSIVVSNPGSVILTVTDQNGCSATDDVQINESTSLSPEITGDSLICNGVSTTLDVGPGYTSYAWSTGSTDQTIDVTTAGVISVTVTDGTGCTGETSFEVMTGSASASITGTDQLCEGETSVLTATAGYDEYLWSNGAQTETIDVSTGGTYTVTVTDQAGCTGTAEFDLTVFTDPVPSITGSATFCTGGSTLLDAGPGYDTYNWSGGQTDQVVTITTPGIVSLTVTDVNGCTGTASVEVVESDELTLIVNDTALCRGDQIELSVGVFETYQWSTGASTATIPVTMGGTYSVTVTDATGCSGTAEIDVAEVNPPFAEVRDTSTCNAASGGSTIDFRLLIGAGDITGGWTDLDGSGATGAFPVLDFDGVTPGNYRFEYTTASAQIPCQDVSYTVTIRVDDCQCPSPALSDPGAVCNDDGPIDLEDYFVSGVTETGGSWRLISDPGGANPASVAGSTLDVAMSDPGIYQIVYEISGVPDGCPTADTVALELVGYLEAGAALEPIVICEEEDTTIQLRALIDGGTAMGTWVETSIVPSIAGFDASSGTFTTGLEMSGTYTFEFATQSQPPCPQDIVVVEVIIEELPVADAGQDRIITCDEPSVQIGGASSSGTDFSYKWSTSNGVLSDSLDATVLVRDAGTYEIAVTNDATGCVSYDEVTVTVEGDIPTNLAYRLTLPRCEGDPESSIEIIGAQGGTEPYTYTYDGADVNGNIITEVPSGEHLLTVIDAFGCTYEVVVFVPDPDFIEGQITGELAILRGEETAISFELQSGVLASNTWYDSDGNVLCQGCDTLRIRPLEDLAIELLLVDTSGCEIRLQATINVTINRDLFVPNVFTPNGDGVNDQVTLYGESGLVITSFRIFSRWGELIFETEDIPAGVPGAGWDGSYGGKDAQPGVYVYRAFVRYIDGTERGVAGDITLIR